ncbi:hypothetical protein [Pedobacter sp. Hv1]|uniref:hypothetical protein n=1 Tax=Pedobacter sp. Hv1 TaxID=1740090 RepID=UPI0006D8C515|nr:hypothetical protein [Pedobacter sp. Hv1]KQC02800.1 hypothetical protein AQF98_04290 [Pedobacter sp. Hv1]
MESKETSVQAIVHVVEEYYRGRQISDICETYMIPLVTFHNWLAEYKPIALELSLLKVENERLREVLIDFVISHPTRTKKKKRNVF